MLVPLVSYFVRPSANLANSFEKLLIQFFCQIPSLVVLFKNFLVVASRTALILRRLLVDGLEAWLVSC